MLSITAQPVLPSPSAATSGSSAQSQAALAQMVGDASAAARQQTPAAVLATGAPAAFFSGTATQATPAQQRSTTIGDSAAAPDEPLTEAEVEHLLTTGDLPAAKQAAPLQRPPLPTNVTTPLTSQFAAQVAAQSLPATTTESGLRFNSTREERVQVLAGPGKKSALFANAKGVDAYGFAAARAVRVNEPAEEAMF